MGCAGFSAENFSWPSWAEPERAPAVEVNRKGGIAHGASLVQFPIISNHLSADSGERAKSPSGQGEERRDSRRRADTESKELSKKILEWVGL
jgi:hypothetical protein